MSIYQKGQPALIVMLTYNDRTVENAHSIFRQCKDSAAQIWGLKEKGLPFGQMQRLYANMKDCGKTTVLEVVAYTEDECLKGAQMAVGCGCDILMGTTFFDSVNQYCQQNNLKYMPFVGRVSGRPSVLEGGFEEMIAQAKQYLSKGVFGFDLLGYRYTGNTAALMQKFVAQANAPTCLAGSINSYKRLGEVKRTAPWAFTIGGAFFQNKFGHTHKEQIDRVCQYIGEPDVQDVLSS